MQLKQFVKSLQNALLCGLLLSACLPALLPNRMGDENFGLEVVWYGQSCFQLRDSLGRTVVFDPFDGTVGYGQLHLKADVLLVTHSHFDHNFKRSVKARTRNIDLLESTGTFSVASSLVVTGIQSYHDDKLGQIHGFNRIFKFKMGGLNVVHLGDLGQKYLFDWQARELKGIDVLFIPVGGVTTIDAVGAKTIINEIKPKFVFPMHHGNIRFYKLDSLEKFSSLYPPEYIVRPSTPKIKIRLADAQDHPVIFLLPPFNQPE